MKNCFNKSSSALPSEVIMNTILQDYTMRLLRVYERYSQKTKLSLPDSSQGIQFSFLFSSSSLFFISFFIISYFFMTELDKTLTLRTLLQIFKKGSTDTSMIIPLFSDDDGAFEIDVEVTFYEFLSVCGYFALQQQNQQSQQNNQQQMKQQNQLSQLLQLQQQQQLLFQQLQSKSFTPSPSPSPPPPPPPPPPPLRDNGVQTPDYPQTTPFLDLFIVRVGEDL